MAKNEHRSFTTSYDGRSNVLQNDVSICEGFDPASGDEHPEVKSFKATWDTGATGSVITKAVVDACGLKPIGVTRVNTAGGLHQANTYLVNIFLPNRVGLPMLRVTESPLAGTDVLVGMDVIGQGDFAVTSFKGKTTFSFRVPSAERIDFVSGSTTPGGTSPNGSEVAKKAKSRARNKAARKSRKRNR